MLAEGYVEAPSLDMGLIPKTKVTAGRIAPLGDPMELLFGVIP